MNYEVLILKRAQKALAALPAKDYQRLRDAIAALAQDPRPLNCRKLVGRDGWRIRAGDYRCIYEIDDEQQVVTVLHVGNRRDVYQ